MKVIKRVPWSYKFTCVGCSSELEAERDDVEACQYGSYGDIDGSQFYVKCPVCSTTKTLLGTGEYKLKKNEEVFVPQDIQNEAWERYRKRVSGR